MLYNQLARQSKVGPIEFFSFWDITCLAITEQILSILPTNFSQKQSKKRAKTLHALALGHFGQLVDESPMYEDDFGVA